MRQGMHWPVQCPSEPRLAKPVLGCATSRDAAPFAGPTGAAGGGAVDTALSGADKTGGLTGVLGSSKCTKVFFCWSSTGLCVFACAGSSAISTPVVLSML
eukprot:CAMPEP_0115319102 /NCGR_PEP_ID=MMETSP0270-20121206/79566_1 /TAXON_ID=71861 /ORGANISM="Scrippsiella trochoidea, Strain CCMP3099" /LENGTH=99 /DNA_ID=CAMNT_0002738731 /DNA_START=246 /DNA_END=545 /DNA_ORIENTATION=+